MGGLPRRATFISQETAKEPEALILDSGNFVTDKPIPEPSVEPVHAKTGLILRAMDRMGYAAAAVGEKDLYLGLDRLRSLGDKTRVKLLSANLTDEKGKPVFETHVIVKTGPITVGVIGLTAQPADRRSLDRWAPGARIGDPQQAAGEMVEKIRGKCDLVVVLSNIGFAMDLELARKIPGIDVLVSGGTKRFMKRPIIEGRTLITSGYYEGRAVGRLLINMEGEIKGWVSRQELDFLEKQISGTERKADTPQGKAKLDALLEKRASALELTLYEPDMVNLAPSIPDDTQVAAMISDYRKELKERSVSGAGQAFRDGEQVRYTGAAVCAGCHESRHRFWLKTDHSRAFASLAPKDAEADPDCIGCHVTGYLRRTGYFPNAPRKDLEGVQCEACHGVGSLHVRDPGLYSLLHLPAAPQCMDCHTEEQDDDFNYLRDRKVICAEAE